MNRYPIHRNGYSTFGSHKDIDRYYNQPDEVSQKNLKNIIDGQKIFFEEKGEIQSFCSINAPSTSPLHIKIHRHIINKSTTITKPLRKLIHCFIWSIKSDTLIVRYDCR